MTEHEAYTSPESLTPTEIHAGLRESIDPSRILIREIERVAFASDASFYRLIPRAVVQPKSTDEVAALFRFSHRHRIPLVFRAGGTSLSGQSITDGILVDLGRYMRSLRVEENGKAIRVQPGVIGQHVNDALRLYRARIGPDPASIASCRIGGILSNNASGMCCGVTQNAYHTLRSITFMLPTGTLIDSSSPDADATFARQEPLLYRGIIDLREHILEQDALVAKIRRKYRTKNTTGYSLNAFLDFECPIDIFSHLLIGAEGTLAWIAEATLSTVPDLPEKYTGLLLFDSLHSACTAIEPLRAAGAAALELMDRAAIRSVQNQPGMPPELTELPTDAAGLLVEFQYLHEAAFVMDAPRVEACIASLHLWTLTTMTRNPVEQAQLWKMRKGMFPSVGAVRASGTTVIIEDVAFPVERLADATLDLRRTLDRHGYSDAILFGHARDGNLHFVLTQSFNSEPEIARYRRFIDDLVQLVVVRYDGALKAEHGTGRNMAPFVEAEWGTEALGVMRELKRLTDPNNLLNPGVILNDDPQAHLKNLKDFPTVEAEVDKCIECGYCEPLCPSRDLTLTPRQRIAVRREMQRLGNRPENVDRLTALERDFGYMVLDTCAADGLCALECPVKIDTGQLAKRFRALRHSKLSHALAQRVARNMHLAESLARVALRTGHALQQILGLQRMERITLALSRVSQRFFGEPFWQWSAEMPRAARPLRQHMQQGPFDAVWFPSCITRMMGAAAEEPKAETPTEILLRLADRAGVRIFLPDDAAGNCCGVPFSSKGFFPAHADALNRIVDRFYTWSNQGRIPIVIDTSPCTLGLKTARSSLSPENQVRWDKLTFLDGIEFARDQLLPRLTLHRSSRSVALHPVCSAVKMGVDHSLIEIAKACSEQVIVPSPTGCCAFAGDRGFLVPELTASATASMAAEIRACKPDACYSSSRTCELAMTRATGQLYRSYLHLLDEASSK